MISTENKRIKAFIDTNVIIDALTERDYSYLASRQVWRCVLNGTVKGYICSKQITDIYYIFRKYYKSEEEIRSNISNIVESFEMLPLLSGDVLACLKTKMPDFEDALIYEIAKVNMIPYIITNNVKHFKECDCLVLTPQQFLDLYSLQ